MPTTATAAVKFALPSTPEKAACSEHVAEGLETFWGVVEHVQHAADRQQAIHQVEETLFRSLRVMGRWLLQAFLDLAGTGDVGPTRTVRSDSPSEAGQQLSRLDRPHERPYLSIFGEIARERTCYGRGRIEAAPLDGRLHLPERPYSSLLQQGLGTFVVEEAQAEAIRELGTILGVEVAVEASEGLDREQAGDGEVFPDRLPVPEGGTEAPLLVVTADCKGVPWVRKALPPDKAADTAPPALANRRRGEGQKANKTKRATVGAVYPIEPFVRTADDGIEEVMRKEALARRPCPRNKRLRADRLVGEVALFVWLADEVIRRNPQGGKPVIFLSDGERALHDRQGESLPEDTVCILAPSHVLERLWKVAWCPFEEGTPKRDAHQGVEVRRERLLKGEVGAVIRGLRSQATQRALKGQRRKTVEGAADYFEGKRDRMKDDESLAAGDPIGSGVAEGACRHLVKDRMERTGMRWLPSGAQAMLDLRAT